MWGPHLVNWHRSLLWFRGAVSTTLDRWALIVHAIVDVVYRTACKSVNIIKSVEHGLNRCKHKLSKLRMVYDWIIGVSTQWLNIAKCLIRVTHTPIMLRIFFRQFNRTLGEYSTISLFWKKSHVLNVQFVAFMFGNLFVSVVIFTLWMKLLFYCHTMCRYCGLTGEFWKHFAVHKKTYTTTTEIHTFEW